MVVEVTPPSATRGLPGAVQDEHRHNHVYVQDGVYTLAAKNGYSFYTVYERSVTLTMHILSTHAVYV